MYAIPFIVIIDLIILNVLLFLFRQIDWLIIPDREMLMSNLLYMTTIFAIRPIAYKRFVLIEKVARRSFTSSIFFFFILSIILYYSQWDLKPLRYTIFTMVATSFLLGGRLLARFLIKTLRHHGRNAKKVVFIGSGPNLGYLYDCMSYHMERSLVFMGYFDKEPCKELHGATYLGGTKKIMSWLKDHHADEIYCNLPSTEHETILPIINYSEKNFIKYYSVPNVRNYIHRMMTVEMIEDMPVLSLLHDPLRYQHNRLFKRIMCPHHPNFDPVVLS